MIIKVVGDLVQILAIVLLWMDMRRPSIGLLAGRRQFIYGGILAGRLLDLASILEWDLQLACKTGMRVLLVGAQLGIMYAIWQRCQASTSMRREALSDGLLMTPCLALMLYVLETINPYEGVLFLVRDVLFKMSVKLSVKRWIVQMGDILCDVYDGKRDGEGDLSTSCNSERLYDLKSVALIGADDDQECSNDRTFPKALGLGLLESMDMIQNRDASQRPEQGQYIWKQLEHGSSQGSMYRDRNAAQLTPKKLGRGKLRVFIWRFVSQSVMSSQPSYYP